MNKGYLISLNLLLVAILLNGIIQTEAQPFSAQFFKEVKRTRQGIITLSAFTEFQPCLDGTINSDRIFRKYISYTTPFTDNTQTIQVALGLYDYSVRKHFETLKFNVTVVYTRDSNHADFSKNPNQNGFWINVNCFTGVEYTELQFVYYATNDWDNLDVVRYEQTWSEGLGNTATIEEREITLQFEDDLISARQYGKIYTVSGLHTVSTLSANTDAATLSTRPKTYKHFWSSTEIPLTGDQNFNQMAIRFSSNHTSTKLHYVYGNIIQWNYYSIQNSYATINLDSTSVIKGVNPLFTIPDRIYTSGRNLELFIGIVGFRQQRIVVDNYAASATAEHFLGLGFNDISQAFTSQGALQNRRIARFAQKSDNFLSGVTLSVQAIKSHNCLDMDESGALYKYLEHETHLNCLQTCKERQLDNDVLELCEPCWDLKCLDCDLDSQNCIECEDGYYVNYHFEAFDFVNKDNHNCLPCVENCRKCDAYTTEVDGEYPGGGQCQECYQVEVEGVLKQFYVGFASKLCVEECPAGEYLPTDEDYLCAACHDDCSTCADLTGDNDECESCSDSTQRLKPNGELDYSKCVVCEDISVNDDDDDDDDDVGYFTSEDAWCQKCHDSCSACVGPNEDDCTECTNHVSGQKSVFLANEGDTSGKCIVCNDLTDDYNGIYYDQSSQFCLPCDDSCHNCVGPSDQQCLSCTDSSRNVGVLDRTYFSVEPVRRFLDHQSHEDIDVYGQCLNCQTETDSYTSGGGFYLDDQYKCQPCDSSCAKCIGPSQDECYRCDDENHQVFNYQFDDYYVDDYYGTCGVCSQQARHYNEEIDQDFAYQCAICHDSCFRCDGPGELDCLQCEFPQESILRESYSPYWDVLDDFISVRNYIDELFWIRNQLSELRSQLTSKVASITSVTASITQQNADLATENQRLTTANGELSAIEADLAAARLALSGMRTTQSDIQSDLQSINFQLNSEYFALNALQSQRASAVSNKNSASNEMSRLEQLILDKTATIPQLVAVISTYQRRISDSSSFLGQFNSKLGSVMAKLGEVSGLISNNRGQASSIDGRLNSIEQIIDQTEDTQLLKALNLEYQTLTASQFNLLQTISNLENIKSEYQAKRDTLINDIAEYQSYIDSSMIEIGQLEDRIDDLNIQINEANIDYGYQDGEYDYYAALELNLDGQIQSLENEINGEEDIRDGLQQDLSQIEGLIELKIQDISELQDGESAKYTEISSIQSEIDQIEDNLVTLGQSLSTLENRKSWLEGQISSLQMRETDVQEDLSILYDVIDDFYYDYNTDNGPIARGACVTCSDFCDIGFYKPDFGAPFCLQCPKLHCTLCDGEGSCERCSRDRQDGERFYVLDGECTKICPSHYQIDGDFCRPCDSSCGECNFSNDEEACFTCSNPEQRVIVLDGPGPCGVCQDQNDNDNTVRGLYTTSSNPNCELCDDLNCHNCDGEGVCYQCNVVDGEQFYVDFYSKECISACPDAQYLDGYLCKACHSTCATCTAPGNLQCDTCIDGYHFHPESGECVVCQDHYGWYSPAEGNECLACSVENCAFCPGDECDACFDGLMLSSDKSNCAPLCPEDEADTGDGQTCGKCHQTCKTCDFPSDEASCTSCHYQQLTYYNSRCVVCQDEGYFYTFDDESTTVCLPCIDNCLKCSGPQADNCSECDGEHFLTLPVGQQGRICAPKYDCPDNLYFDGQYCSDCTTNCDVECTGPSGLECSVCQIDLGFYKHPDGQNILRCMKCPDHYVGQDWDGYCGECAPNCKSCQPCRDCPLQGLVDSCTECLQGYYLDSETNQCKVCNGPREVIQGIFCVECPSFTYADQELNTCEACIDNCESCIGSEFLQCEKCEPDYYQYLKKNTCIPFPPDGERYYLYNENQYIDDCIENCLFCDGPETQHCFICQQGYGLQDGQCIQCGDTHFYGCENNRYCLDCSPGCQTCHGTHHLECDQCLETHCMDQTHTCVPNYATYTDGEGICKACMKDCIECNDGLSCEVCKTGYYWIEGIGMQACEEVCLQLPEGYEWADNNQKCIECQVAEQDEICVEQCAVGYDISSTKRCRTCADLDGENYLVYDPISKKCTIECPQGFQEDPLSNLRECRQKLYVYREPLCGIDSQVANVRPNEPTTISFSKPFSAIPRVAISIVISYFEQPESELQANSQILEISRSGFTILIELSGYQDAAFMVSYVASDLNQVDIVPFTHSFDVPLNQGSSTFGVTIPTFYTGGEPKEKVSLAFISGYHLLLSSEIGFAIDSEFSQIDNQVDVTIHSLIPSISIRRVDGFLLVIRDPEFQMDLFEFNRQEILNNQSVNFTPQERAQIFQTQMIDGQLVPMPYIHSITTFKHQEVQENTLELAIIPSVDYTQGTYTVKFIIPKIKVCPGEQVLQLNQFCVDKCAQGYRVVNSRCVECQNEDCSDPVVCKPGQFSPDQVDCLDCPSGCLSCGIVGQGIVCETCLPNFQPIEGGCVCEPTRHSHSMCGDTCRTCPSEYYPISDDIQVQGFEYCQLGCEFGYLSNDGYFCLPCNQGNNCLTCSDGEYCDTCNQGFKKLSSGICVDTCQAGSYYDGEIEYCYECSDPGCIDCSNDTSVCDQCDSETVHLNGQCLESCPSGFGRSLPESNFCTECADYPVCITCTQDARIGECQTCDLERGFTNDDGACVCSLGNQRDADGQNCIPCSYAADRLSAECVDECPLGEVPVEQICTPCTGSLCYVCDSQDLSSCLSCQDNRKILDGECIEGDCPIGTYDYDDNEIAECETCRNLVFEDTSCVLDDSCPDGFYQIPETNICKACLDPNCKICNDGSIEASLAGVCSECNSPKVLQYETLDCDSDTCAVRTQLDDSNKVCIPCVHVQLDGITCGDSCEKGSYDDQENVDCQACESNIAGCIDCGLQEGILICNQCNGEQGLKLNPDLERFSSNICINCLEKDLNYHSNNEYCQICPQGEYASGTEQDCVACPIGDCATCDYIPVQGNPENQSEDPLECLACKSSYYLDDEGQCVQQCGDFYFENTTTGRCQKCVDDVVEFCQTCQSEVIDGLGCSFCADGFYMDNIEGQNMCVSECQVGYFGDDSDELRLCKVCDDSCAECSGTANNCSVCNEGYIFESEESSTCVTDCQTKEYIETENGAAYCAPCELNCQTCIEKAEAASACTLCVDGFFMALNADKTQSDYCVEDCGEGNTYLVAPRLCNPCVEFCLNCPDQVCDTCEEGFEVNDSDECSCIPGTFLPLGATTCSPCSSGCSVCSEQGLELSVCDTCDFEAGYYVDNINDVCTQTCPDTTYPNDITGVCQDCPSDCQQCPNNESCSVCIEDHYRLDGVCTLAVQPFPDYAVPPDESLDLVACNDENCKYCDYVDASTNTCTECNTNYVFFSQQDQTCVVCPIGTFNNGNVCQECNSDCHSCIGAADVCDVCAGNQIKDSEGNCVCPAGYWKYQSVISFLYQSSCIQCDYRCATCSNPFTCDTCAANRVGESCDCPVGTYQSACGTKAQCDTCHSSCSSCRGPGELDCLECAAGKKSIFRFSDLSCVSSCPEGYYQGDENNCNECDYDCLTCTGPSNDQCLTCAPHTFQLGTSCFRMQMTEIGFQSCPEFYEFENGIRTLYHNSTNRECMVCPEFCLMCISSGNCLQCAPGQYNFNGVCVAECPDGTFVHEIGNTCEKCDSSCTTCAGKTNQECLTCQPGSFLTHGVIEGDVGMCFQTCPRGYWTNRQTNQCVQCVDCDQCVNDQTCLNCPYGYYSFVNPNDETVVTCHQSCPRGSFLEGAQCVSCKSRGLINYNGKCVKKIEQCPQYHYMDEELAECIPCHNVCSDCTGPEENQCTECKANYYLLENSCLSVCPPTFFNDITTSTCSSCPENCLSCNSRTVCLQCNVYDEFFLSPTQTCVSDCPSGYYPDYSTGRCEVCSYSCGQCYLGGNQECSSCPANRFLLLSACVSQCPRHMFALPDSTCVPCHETCFSCSGPLANNCTACPEGLFLSQNRCLFECPDGTYADFNSRTCKACATGCATCIDGSSNACLSCTGDNFVLHAIQSNNNSQEMLPYGRCVASCPSKGYFGFAGHCGKCDCACESCDNPTPLCLTCASGYFREPNSGACTKDCPPNQIKNHRNGMCVAKQQGNCGISHHLYDNDGTCTPCDASCKRCDGPGTKKCLSCNAGFFLRVISATESECIATAASCGAGFYQDTVNNVCQPCPAKCKTCSSATVCTACKDGSDRILGADGSCQCPAGRLIDSIDGLCPVCELPCASCTGFTYNCNTCIASRDQIMTMCPCAIGFFSATSGGACQKCDNKCSTCENSATNCVLCRGDRVGANCTCPSGLFDDGVSEYCQGCDYKCLTCSNANTCLTCGPNRNAADNCRCNAGFFEDARSRRCLPCSNKCNTCSGSADNCLTCKGNRLSAPACTCPNMMADKGALNCEPFTCSPECSTCNELGCLSCASNRVGPFSLKCICPIQENGIQRQQLGTATCGTCLIGVPSATFSPNLQQIRLEFGQSMSIGDLFYDKTNKLCEELFPSDNLLQMGQNPNCFVTPDYLAIKLGPSSTIRENQVISMRNNSRPLLNFDNCREIDNSLKFLKLFTRASLKLPTERLTPRVFFQKLANPVSICSDVVLNIVDTDVTGNRMPSNIVWKLDSVVPANQAFQALVQKIVSNGQGKSQIVLPSTILVQKTTVSFTVTFVNFLGVAGSEQVEFTTSGAETLLVTLKGNDNTVYRRNQWRLAVSTEHLICQAGQIEKKQSQRQLSLTYQNGPEDISSKIIKLSDTQFMIQEYILQSGQTYNLELNINVPSNSDINVKKDIDLNVGVSDLVISLNGAQDLISINQLTQFESTVRNVDLPQDEDTVDLYTFAWSIYDSNIEKPAQDQLTAIEDENGLVISTPIETSTTNVQTILPNQLEPFHTIEVTVFVTTTNQFTNSIQRQKYTQKFISTTSPVNSHQFFLPADLMGREFINLQDELNFEIELLPEEDVSDMFYSIQVVHEEKVQATYTFPTNVFSFALWDQPIDLTSESSGDLVVTLVNTKYNSQLSILSSASIDIKINPIPTSAYFSIYRIIQLQVDGETTSAATDSTTDNQVYDPVDLVEGLQLSNQDRYLVSLDGCQDADGNLEYEFFYYSSEADRQEELRSSVKNQIKRIRQRGPKQSEELELVMGDIVLLASCYDGNNGVLNITLPLQVVSPDSGTLPDAPIAARLRNMQSANNNATVDPIKTQLDQLLELQQNTLTEVSQLAGFVMNNLIYNVESYNTIDNYIIERLFYNMFNNTQPEWVRESVKILSEIFQKNNIIEYNTNYTACHQYLDLIQDFINQTITTYQNDLASAIQNNLPQPSTDNQQQIFLNIFPVISSIVKSSFLMSPKKLFTDIQTKYERQSLQKINSQLIEIIKSLESGLRYGNLPGSANIVYEDENIFIETGVTTPSQITSRLNPPVSVDTIVGISAIDKNLISGVSSGQTDGFLDFGIIKYKKNIFISDPKFHYYRSTYPVFDITLMESVSYTASRNNRATRNIQSRRQLQTTGDTTERTGAQEMELNPPSISYFFPVQQTNSVKPVDYTHLTCISSSGTDEWTSARCQKNSVLDVTNRLLGVQCSCELPELITLVDDVDYVYSSQDSSLLAEIQNGRYNVALEPLFYAFLFFTFDYVILMIWAFYQDKHDASEEPVKVIQRQLTRAQTIADRKRKSMMINNGGLVPLDGQNYGGGRQQSAAGSNVNDSHRSNQSQNDREEQPNFHFQPDQNNIVEDEPVINSKDVNQQHDGEQNEIEMKNFILAVQGNKPSNIVSPKLDSEEQDLISANRPITANNYDQQQVSKLKEIDINVPEDQNNDRVISKQKPIQSYNNQGAESYVDNEDINLALIEKDDHSLINYYLMHHSIISIFRIYMVSQPRQFRFTEEYVQINLYLWSMLLFSSELVSENAVVILVTLFAVKIICSIIIEGPLLSKEQYLRMIGYVIIAGIFAGSVIVSVYQSFVLERQVMRNAFYNFIILIFFDYCIFDFIKCTFLFYKKEHEKHHPKNLD